MDNGNWDMNCSTFKENFNGLSPTDEKNNFMRLYEIFFTIYYLEMDYSIERVNFFFKNIINKNPYFFLEITSDSNMKKV